MSADLSLLSCCCWRDAIGAGGGRRDLGRAGLRPELASDSAREIRGIVAVAGKPLRSPPQSALAKKLSPSAAVGRRDRRRRPQGSIFLRPQLLLNYPSQLQLLKKQINYYYVSLDLKGYSETIKKMQKKVLTRAAMKRIQMKVTAQMKQNKVKTSKNQKPNMKQNKVTGSKKRTKINKAKLKFVGKKETKHEFKSYGDNGEDLMASDIQGRDYKQQKLSSPARRLFEKQAFNLSSLESSKENANAKESSDESSNEENSNESNSTNEAEQGIETSIIGHEVSAICALPSLGTLFSISLSLVTYFSRQHPVVLSLRPERMVTRTRRTNSTTRKAQIAELCEMLANLTNLVTDLATRQEAVLLQTRVANASTDAAFPPISAVSAPIPQIAASSAPFSPIAADDPPHLREQRGAPLTSRTSSAQASGSSHPP
ncbi:hypothetical protein AXF42_Ash005636 [Apostasia shenzhenica]|uniref:Uncharacterized protein n=1 Tax=Apostasia shenzhenica TaxID=1088818 RepID=A0A2I0BBX8_9ASPA|nr:hypothetical protein AXF42_Ash005636 [Apostasia shenzhenica]